MTQKMQNYLDKSIQEDKIISITLASSFVILTIQYLILIYFNLIETSIGNSIQLFSKILVGFFYIRALPIVLKRNKFKFISVYFISIFIFLLNYIFFNENWTYLLSIIFPLFFTCIPSLIYSYSINDWDIFGSIVKIASLVIFIVGSIIAVLTFMNKTSVGAYSMGLSYYMLLPAIIYMNDFFDKFNLRPILFASICTFIILTLGSRGAILCLAIFVVLKLISLNKKLNYKTILVYLIVISLIVIFLVFFDTILDNLYDFLLQFGINSRSLRLFLRDDIHLSGRDNLYKAVIQEIQKSPLFGIGLAGDRRVIGGYVHNIGIEIIANFGVIIGSLILILLVIISFKALFLKDRKTTNVISIWFSIGVIPLLVSSSYLTDLKFWIFLGLSLKAILRKNKK